MTVLAQGTFHVDMPDDCTTQQVENWVAHAIAWYFNMEGLPGNATVTCLSLTPEISVAHPTKPIPFK
jgi:hypothetical protein